MSSVSVHRVLLRRWPMVLIGALLAVGAAFGMTSVVPAEHEISADVLLLPPEEDVQGQGNNPYLLLDGLDNMAAILSRALASTTVGEELAASGATAEYVVAPDQVQGSLLTVTVTDPSPAGAAKTLDAVLKAVPEQLRSLQSLVSTPSNVFITSTVIRQDREGVLVRTSQYRAVVMAFGGLLGLTCLGTVLLDIALSRWRGKRPGQLPEPAAVPALGGPPPAGPPLRTAPPATAPPAAGTPAPVRQPREAEEGLAAIRAVRDSWRTSLPVTQSEITAAPPARMAGADPGSPVRPPVRHETEPAAPAASRSTASTAATTEAGAHLPTMALDLGAMRPADGGDPPADGKTAESDVATEGPGDAAAGGTDPSPAARPVADSVAERRLAFEKLLANIKDPSSDSAASRPHP